MLKLNVKCLKLHSSAFLFANGDANGDEAKKPTNK